MALPLRKLTTLPLQSQLIMLRRVITTKSKSQRLSLDRMPSYLSLKFVVHIVTSVVDRNAVLAANKIFMF